MRKLITGTGKTLFLSDSVPPYVHEGSPVFTFKEFQEMKAKNLTPEQASFLYQARLDLLVAVESKEPQDSAYEALGKIKDSETTKEIASIYTTKRAKEAQEQAGKIREIIKNTEVRGIENKNMLDRNYEPIQTKNLDGKPEI